MIDKPYAKGDPTISDKPLPELYRPAGRAAPFFERNVWYRTQRGLEFQILDECEMTAGEETATCYATLRDGACDWVLFNLHTTKRVAWWRNLLSWLGLRKGVV